MFEVLEGVLLILAGYKTCKQTCSDSMADLSNDVFLFVVVVSYFNY